jgi:hypothetical protein
MKSVRRRCWFATTTRRAGLRVGLETMPLSRPQPKIAVVMAVVLAFLLPSAALAQPVASSTITADGVGDAMLGSSPQELADALGADYDIGDEIRITVDFDGRVISRDGVVQFRAAMTNNTDDLTLFIVSNPEYTTAPGVGPTTTIAEAEAIYGDATLAWNNDNKGREFVSFADGPEGRIAFRTPGIGGTNVGIYADGEFETSNYADGAAIASVWVSCVSGTDCPADRTVETTPEPAPAPVAGDGSGASDSELPRTGTTELVLMSLVATLFVVGGALVLVERRYLCPAWLKLNSRR